MIEERAEWTTFLYKFFIESISILYSDLGVGLHLVPVYVGFLLGFVLKVPDPGSCLIDEHISNAEETI